MRLHRDIFRVRATRAGRARLFTRDAAKKGGITVKGLHIIADLYHCSRDKAEGGLLTSAGKLRSLCVGACEAVGLTVLGEHFHQFDGADATQKGGTTGTVVLAESHLAIHTWPERDCATLDVYVCNYTADNSQRAETLYQTLIDALAPGAIQVERIWRGMDSPVMASCLTD
jgi:S-adenosylmethionine decarboxylase